jgi:hypothetical protein
VTVPGAWATTLIAGPSLGVTLSSFPSPAAQKKETRETSVSEPPACANARALKVRASPSSSVAPAGVISMRESAGEPNGVPSARVPGE